MVGCPFIEPSPVGSYLSINYDLMPTVVELKEDGTYGEGDNCGRWREQEETIYLTPEKGDGKYYFFWGI